VAEGADTPLSLPLPLPHTVDARHAAMARCPPALCVATVLSDALHRLAVLGGREGMPRSLGSVYAGSVTRFIGGSLRGVVSRVIDTPGVRSETNGVAVSVDGGTLLAADGRYDGSHAIHEFDLADGCRRRVVGEEGAGPLQFSDPRQLCIAPDDYVFVADAGNSRVQVLTPTLDFHSFVGEGKLIRPVGVCANADVVVVSEPHHISVFSRDDGALLRRFGCHGTGDGKLEYPLGLCFMSDDRHVAVADQSNHRVSVFSVEGEFIRHVGVGVLGRPHGVAASAFDELVVADKGNHRVVVFNSAGDVVTTVAVGAASGVVIHGGAVFAQSYGGEKCVVFA
jgi:DNA-binding beta-propeller fold protein YncE